MSDRDKLKALLTEFGVGYHEDEEHVYCEEGAAKVCGYCAFYTMFQFDTAGKFVTMGAYE